MPRYIALLRAINVGGHNVKMEALRTLFLEQGFLNVETFIASGNVIFEATESNANLLETKIGAFLRESLGYEVPVFLRTTAEMSAIVAGSAFDPVSLKTAGHSVHIGFLATAPNAEAVCKLQKLETENDVLNVTGRELFWLCRIRTSESKITGATLERAVGMPTTLRNLTTVHKLADRFG